MKSLFAAAAGLVALGCCTPAAYAQVYAPATEYHDPVQRVFVVEAARVVAWWNERGRATNLTEVAYDVTTKADQSTVWDSDGWTVQVKPSRARRFPMGPKH